MNFYRLHLGILFCFFSLNLLSQNNNSVHEKKHRFALYGGVGPNYYFNNLDIYKNSVNSRNYSSVVRLMWEPEHFLSLGIESGYNQLYSVKYTTQAFGPVQVTNIIVPLQLVVSMKFLKNYYTAITMGQTYFINKFSNLKLGSFNTYSWSLADFGVSGGYRYHFKNRISVGAEAKYFYSSKYNDRNMALVFMVGYCF